MNREVKIGIFAVVVILVSAWLIITVSNIKIKKSSYKIIVDFNYIGGLDKGAPVRISGVRVGEVKKVFLFEGHPRVICTVEKDVRITKDAQIYINTLGIIGENYIEIKNGSNKIYYPNKNIETPFIGRDAVSVGDLIYNLNAFSMKLSRFEQSINLINSALSDLKKNLDKMYPQFEDMLKPLQNMSGDITNLINNGNTLLDRSNKVLGKIPIQDIVKKLELSLDNINDLFVESKPIVNNLKQGKGLLGKILNDDSIYKDAKKLTVQLEQMINKSKKVRFEWNADLISSKFTNKFEGYLGMNLFLDEKHFYNVGFSYINNKTLLSANLNVVWKHLLFSGGIFQDTPLLGTGYMNNHWYIRLDAYNWNYGLDNLNLRFSLRYYLIYGGINLSVDNIIYKPTVKLGLTLRFDEKDFKYLIGIVR